MAADAASQGVLAEIGAAKIPPFAPLSQVSKPAVHVPVLLSPGITGQMLLLLEQTQDCCPPLGNYISELCIDAFIFITTSALLRCLHTAAGDHYPGIMLNPTDIIRLTVETRDLCQPFVAGWLTLG